MLKPLKTSYIPTFLHFYIPTFPHSYIPTFLHSYIPTLLHSYIPLFHHSIIPSPLISLIIKSCNLFGGDGQTSKHTNKNCDIQSPQFLGLCKNLLSLANFFWAGKIVVYKGCVIQKDKKIQIINFLVLIQRI